MRKKDKGTKRLCGLILTFALLISLLGSSLSDVSMVQAEVSSVPVDTNTYYEIKNVATGQCLDIPNGADENGLQLQTWEDNDADAQRFVFKTNASADWYSIIPKCAPTRAVDNPSGALDEGVIYQTWERNGCGAQEFQFDELEDGSFHIINRESQLALTDLSADGGKVVQQGISDNDNQKWLLNKIEYESTTLYDKIEKIPGIGDVLYENHFNNGEGMTYYPGTSPSVPRYENDTLIIGGGNANKVIVNDQNFTDFVLEADIKVSENNTDDSNQGGLVFRVSNAVSGVSDGYDGYYFGIDAAAGKAILGKVHGNTWIEIATKRMTVNYDTYYHVAVAVSGSQINCYVNYHGTNYAKIVAVDEDFTEGSVGVRQWLAGASYKNLTVSAYTPEILKEAYTNSLVADSADPDVLYHDGVYYMYATHTAASETQGFKVYTSTDLVNWKDEGWALQKGNVYGESGFWAPDLIERDGIFYMYYVADEHLSVATSTSPLGPFTQTAEEMVPMHDINEIDAHVFLDDDGQYYIYFVRFSDGNHIYGAKLNDDMRTMDESTITCLISPEEPWETNMANITEGPFMLKKDGVYYLTYSGSHFESSMYGSGYATSTSPLGAYSKYKNNPIMQSNSMVHGAGHHCVTESPDGEELYIVYHRHYSLTQTDPRCICIDKMQFVTDDEGNTVLEVCGPTLTAQAMPSGTNMVLDTARLNDAISKAEELLESDYTMVSWANLQSALVAAKTLGEEVSQEEIDVAADTLEEAIEGLERKMEQSSEESTTEEKRTETSTEVTTQETSTTEEKNTTEEEVTTEKPESSVTEATQEKTTEEKRTETSTEVTTQETSTTEEKSTTEEEVTTEKPELSATKTTQGNSTEEEKTEATTEIKTEEERTTEEKNTTEEIVTTEKLESSMTKTTQGNSTEEEKTEVTTEIKTEEEQTTEEKNTTEEEVTTKKPESSATELLQESSTEEKRTEATTEIAAEGERENSAKLQLDISKKTLGVKEKYQLKVKVLQSDTAQQITFKSSNNKVAIVNSKGKITAKKTGTAVIVTRLENGATAKCKLTVKRAPQYVKLKIKAKTIKRGKQYKIKASLSPKSAGTITYKSSNKRVAMVNEKGVIKARKKGKATITIQTYNKKKTRLVVYVK